MAIDMEEALRHARQLGKGHASASRRQGCRLQHIAAGPARQPDPGRGRGGGDQGRTARPGDELRSYEPRFGAASAGFALLNRGKRSIALDLKARGAKARLMPLLRSADVLIEQFRPGVMDRLGLGLRRSPRSTRS